jgi:hypothetical protein
MPSSKPDDRRADGATTIRFSDYETRGAHVSWSDAQIQRPEIRLPQLALKPGRPPARADR